MYLKENPLGEQQTFHVISITILSFIHWIFLSKPSKASGLNRKEDDPDVRRADDLKRMISASTHTDGSAFRGHSEG